MAADTSRTVRIPAETQSIMVPAETLRNSAPAEGAGRFASYVAVVIAVAATLIFLHPAGPLAGSANIGVEVWLMAALALLADAWPWMPPGRRLSSAVFPSICFTFAILIDSGLPAALVVQTAAVIVSSIRMKHRPWRALFNIAQYTLALTAAQLVIHAGSMILPVDAPTGAYVVVFVAAALTWFALKYTTTSIAVWLRFGGPFWSTIRVPFVSEALTTGSLLLLGTVLAEAATASPLYVPLAVVPLLAVQRLSVLSMQQSRLARLDPLTGLANRKVLISEVGSIAADYARSGGRGSFALLLLDLDRFKHVNDALGHAVGDRLLVAVADRLAKGVREGDLVARLGGDEFAIIAGRLTGPQDAVHLAARVTAALQRPISLDGLPLDISASVGIALYPEHGTDFATLMRHADVAMYDAKHRGDGVAIYAAESDHNSPRRLSLVADLRQALESPDGGGLTIYYQPQVEIATGEVVGVEALLRWSHPHYGPIDPEELIKAAEPSSVMRQLTRWVLEHVIEQLAIWRPMALRLRCAVNVSVRDLHTDDIVEHVTALLRTHGVTADQLQLEITEEGLMADPNRVLVTLGLLDRLGVAIALDDFGTGYSSMQHLRRMPLAEVKIDRTFVFGMRTDPDDAAIVRSIIDLAGALGLRVVAEGVEDEPTWRLLHECGCEVAQGWFYARPMPADELIGWLGRTTVPGARRLAGLPVGRSAADLTASWTSEDA
ncbi:putative bifunctional diguanylate cyclase/phosphodiesterase [Hamadaea tsunoensis]|uniref:putative bifunctional diguanylate cyclase/phosphodiesterase n=1 Tax=Hamadaea tsunoensis TaxID=53368 RepID=UPI000421435A|nr:EAL domain-containing protein [Hamadaea tsunoensis]